MISMVWFGVIDLLRNWKLALAMSLVATVAIIIFLTLVGYQNGLETQFGMAESNLPHHPGNG